MFNDHISDHPQHPINLIIFFITVMTNVLFEFMIKIMIKIMINVLIRCAECVAIGECGLDFNRNFSPPEVQIEVFEKQVIVIKKLKGLSSTPPYLWSPSGAIGLWTGKTSFLAWAWRSSWDGQHSWKVGFSLDDNDNMKEKEGAKKFWS